MDAREALTRIGIAVAVILILGAGGIAAVQIAKSDLDDYREEVESDLEEYADEAVLHVENAMVEMCERVKADRVDNARGWTEMEHYMEGISKEGPTEDIRDQAADSRVKVGESANQLRSRLFLCEPLIREGAQAIDDRALREAQGDL